MSVTHHDQVCLHLLGIAGDFFHRIAHQQRAAGLASSALQALQTVFQSGLHDLPLAIHHVGVKHAAFHRNQSDPGWHHRHQRQFSVRPLG